MFCNGMRDETDVGCIISPPWARLSWWRSFEQMICTAAAPAQILSHTHTHTNTEALTNAHALTHTYTYTRIYKHKHTYAYTHTQTQNTCTHKETHTLFPVWRMSSSHFLMLFAQTNGPEVLSYLTFMKFSKRSVTRPHQFGWSNLYYYSGLMAILQTWLMAPCRHQIHNTKPSVTENIWGSGIRVLASWSQYHLQDTFVSHQVEKQKAHNRIFPPPPQDQMSKSQSSLRFAIAWGHRVDWPTQPICQF